MMSSESPTTEGPPPYLDPKSAIDRFRLINDARLQRTYDSITPSQAELIQLLPLYFCINHPMLPGYVSKDTPCGIECYEPNKELLNLVKRQAKSLQYQKVSRNEIQALYVMGSAGSIAFNEQSDFDFWLCYHPSLDPLQIEKLSRKALALEQWGEKMGLELHFFLMNADAFRLGTVNALSSESSGTAQHALLLDEFYRTGLLLAGRVPSWWAVPPNQGHTQSLKEFELKRFIFYRDLIDFGNLEDIPSGEYFGAAVWQLAKAIESPYKSMIKLLLIETYVSEYPQVRLLSQQFKEQVYLGETNLEKLDPYLNLLEKLERYLKHNRDTSRLELLYRAFYLKLNLPMSKEDVGRRQQWRRERFNDIIAGWGWAMPQIVKLDSRGSWTITLVSEERQNIFDALALSYRALKTAVRVFSESNRITDDDLMILGRKLYAAYERKAGKVEIVSRGSQSNLHMKSLSIHESRDLSERPVWQLFTGYVDVKSASGSGAIKQARSLIEIIAWGYFNGVIDRTSAIAVFTKNPEVVNSTISKLVDRFYKSFPEGVQVKSSTEDFASAAVVRQSDFFINVGAAVTGGFNPHQHGATGRFSDPLSLGYKRISVLERLDLVAVNSWNEVMVSSHIGNRGVVDGIVQFFKWYVSDPLIVPQVPDFFSLGIRQGTSIPFRLHKLFENMIACFFDGKGQLHRHYILCVGTTIFAITLNQGIISSEQFANEGELSKFLSQSRYFYNRVTFDEFALLESPLPLIYSNHRSGVIQFFYLVRGNLAHIHILDERGMLFVTEWEYLNSEMLLRHYDTFFDAVINRMNLLIQDGPANVMVEGVEWA
ncbi:MAG: class I adenylate cyclase [Gammaproteobacteria bacterium]|nr:class I adenylate cyclase [Gammaproteobacteria bacterium]